MDDLSLAMDGRDRSFEGVAQGVTLCFDDIDFWATTRSGERKPILKNVSGTCQPGRLLALMGASGIF